MNKKITNKEKVKESLNKAGHRLSIDEALHLTGLTKTQVRNTANYYDNDIVFVGRGEIDIFSRAYKGRGLRATPTKNDIKTGTVCSDELFIYLWPISHSFEKVTLFSKDGMNFRPERGHFPNSQSAIGDFSKWYKLTNFQPGDDIIFKCHNSKKQEFEIFRLPSEERNEKEILHRNNQLGEIIYNMLKHYTNKYEMLYFLTRKYLLRDLYLKEILPDQITRALSTNPYLFIFEHRLQKISYLNVGIKKYFHHQEEYIIK